MNFSEQDILACPPPLYHCFGLVLGLLAAFTHGSCTVFPSETFNPEAVVRAVLEEKCTACHGVPAMWVAVLEKTKPGQDFSQLRTGISAGSPTPRALMENIRGTLNLKELTNTYGTHSVTHKNEKQSDPARHDRDFAREFHDTLR